MQIEFEIVWSDNPTNARPSVMVSFPVVALAAITAMAPSPAPDHPFSCEIPVLKLTNQSE